MITEIWRTPIDKGEIYDNYQVSNLGRILSLNYHQTGRAELLNPGDDGHGYFQVILCKDGEQKTCKVHRLVAQTFLPNPDNLPFINHKDEDKTNNSVENLEWCSREYNNNYGTRNERISKKLTNGKRSKKVLQFSLTGELIQEWPSTAECGRNGFKQGNIVKCCQGKRKSHKGFKWCYA